MDLNTRRCGCGAIFRLATLRARETLCTQCQRKRASGLVMAAVDRGILRPVSCRSGNTSYTDYRPTAPVVRDKPAVRPGQLFETRNEAELAMPDGWHLQASISGGFRVFPPAHPRAQRKPSPGPAKASGSAATPRTMDERIQAAREVLEERRRERAEAEAARRVMSADPVQVSPGPGPHTFRHGDKIMRVIADPSVPQGLVIMQWTDDGGRLHRDVMHYDSARNVYEGTAHVRKGDAVSVTMPGTQLRVTL